MFRLTLIYLMFAFIKADFNIQNWHIVSRILAVIIYLVWSFSIVAYWTDNKDKFSIWYLILV